MSLNKIKLSKKLIKNVKKLEEEYLKKFKLSKEQWSLFSKLFAYNTNKLEGGNLSKKEVNKILKNKSKYKTKKQFQIV